MADNELNIVITATDKASNALRGVRGSVISLNQGLELASKAFTMVKNIVEESVGAYVKYADQVRRLSQLNGTSAQETSQLIQVMDDHKVSTEALMMATRKLSQQGLSLTIDSLGKMSDEYLKLGSSSEKTKFLLDKFGRSGLQMAETMRQGSKAIKEQSEAISSNLILTEKQVDAARQYEIQLDQLSDEVQGFKVALGTALMPVLLNTTEQVKTGLGAWGQMGGQLRTISDLLIDKGNPALLAYGRYMGFLLDKIGVASAPTIDYAGAVDYYASEAAIAAQKTKDWDDASEDLEAKQEDMASTLATLIGLADKTGQEYMTAMHEWIAASYEAQLAADGVLDEEDMQKVLDYRVELGLLTEAQYEAAQKALAHKAVIDSLKSKEITITTWYLSGYGMAGAYEGGVKTQQGSTRRASGGSIPAGGMAWVGDSPSGLTPHSELVYAPHGAQVFNANQSRSMGAGGSPRAFTGGMIPGASGDMNLSSETIRRLASAIAGEVSRING